MNAKNLGKKELTIATYNNHHFQEEGEICRNIETLMANGCDVICLQECTHEEGFSKAKSIITSILPKGWNVIYFHDEKLGSIHGFATLWKEDHITSYDTQTFFLPQSTKRDVLKHLYIQPNAIHGRRGSLIVTFKYQDTLIRVTNLHLDVRGGMKHRLNQLQHMREYLDQNKQKHEVICGDFNTVGLLYWAQWHKKKVRYVLGSEFVDGFVKPNPTHDLLLSTERTILTKHALSLMKWIKSKGFSFRQQLDYIFVKGMRVVSGKKHELNGSDHIPLQVTVVVEL